MSQLTDQVAIVTGSGQGIGRGIAFALASEGAAICVAELDPERGDETARLIRERGGRAISVATDVRSREAIERATAGTIAEFARVDILVNNAQAMRQQVTFEETTDDDMRLAFDSGTHASFRFMQACLPHLKMRGGRVINLASSAGLAGTPGWTSYAVAKEGIRALTKVAAQEWGEFGITVNAICPLAESEGSKQWASKEPKLAARMIQGIPLRRMGVAETDIGRAVVFLASRDAGFITGATLMVDGGQYILH